MFRSTDVRNCPRVAPYAVMLLILAGEPFDATARDKRVPVADGISPITSAQCADMKAHHVLGPSSPIGCERLALVRFSYFGFDNQMHSDGEIVVMDAAAKHALRIFETLREQRFTLAKARRVDAYEGDDGASMKDNNTSAFNSRNISGGRSISLHAYGLAIDLNPIQNPSVSRTGTRLEFNPAAGMEYANRRNDRPWKTSRPGMAEDVIDVFADNGFLLWGGYWDNPIDYQHFQVSRPFAARLAGLSRGAAATAFDDLVARYQRCRRTAVHGRLPTRHDCLMQAEPDGNQP